MLKKKKAGISFELFCVSSLSHSSAVTCEAVRYVQERKSPPSILGKPTTDVEHLFIWLGCGVFLSFFSYQRVRHLQYVTVNQQLSSLIVDPETCNLKQFTYYPSVSDFSRLSICQQARHCSLEASLVILTSNLDVALVSATALVGTLLNQIGR